MAIAPKHKYQVYVEIDARKSKKRRMRKEAYFPPFRSLSPGTARHLWAKGTPIQHLRAELGLDNKEFNELTFDMRSLAKEHLDMTRTVDDQDAAAWERYVQSVCEEHPYFERFEGHWPIGIYMSKFLTKYLQRAEVRKRQDKAALRNNQTESARIEISLEAIPRPSIKEEVDLVDVNSSPEALQAAMGLKDRAVYRSWIEYIQNLSKTYLVPDKLFCEQDEWDWRAFVRKVSDKFPFTRQHDNFWPVQFHMKKYLERCFDARARANIAACHARRQAATRAVCHAYMQTAPLTRRRLTGRGSALRQQAPHPESPSPNKRPTARPGPALRIPAHGRLDRELAMKAQRNILDTFRGEGKITEGQHAMLLGALQKALML